MDAIYLIGERLNSTHSSVKRILEERDAAAFRALVEAQIEGGASCIDLNASMLMSGEEAALRWGAGIVREAFGVPVMIDSPDKGILMSLGGEYGDACMLNSISADGAVLEEILPVAARMGAGVVVMLKDMKGIPPSAEEKLSLAARVSTAAAKAGIAPERLFIDPVFSPVATASGGMGGVLECIRRIREHMPAHRTIGGLSNVSFGLPERKLINRSFAAMAAAFGISALICDTTDRELVKTLKASETLSGRDRSCRKFLEWYRRERETQ
ncbi:MAG: dihydropteroate synthase [Candidatus Krumholzibacteria bacterium]|nr:dihydropteroate synthase [Candidatus Krumholzibacteria bacterium]